MAPTIARKKRMFDTELSDCRSVIQRLRRFPRGDARQEVPMNIQLRSQGIEVSEGLRAHAERCVGFALRRFGSRIDRVSVWLEDVNGPDGGVDKRCGIAVRLRPTGGAFVAKSAPDAYVAVGRAAGRAGSAVARRIARQQERRRDGDRLALVIMQHGEEA
jgi:hypothetical protein